jgi:hypothetical protein
MQTGSSDFAVSYDPSYGIGFDLIEVSLYKLFGTSGGIEQDQQFNNIILGNNPNGGVLFAGHSAGGERLYLENKANPSSFTDSVLLFLVRQ